MVYPLLPFANKGKTLHYTQGTVIFVQRDNAALLYLILDGVVKISIFTEAGDERIIEFIKPQRFLGAPDLFSGSLYGITAIAHTDTLVACFSAEEAKKMFENDREFAVCLVKSISQHSRSLGRLIVGDSFFPAVGRVGFALLSLAVQIGTTEEGGVLKLAITHNEIAKYVGCNRVTVTNVLSELASIGLLAKGNKYLLLEDMDALRYWLNTIVNV